MKDYDFLMIISIACILISFFLIHAGLESFYSGFHNVDLIMNRYIWSVNINRSKLMSYNETLGSGKDLMYTFYGIGGCMVSGLRLLSVE